ncbi:hypothetical protein [Sneathiella sp.]|uniref:hypothetical protein n=1 Tax=Sneathiella sp. TaxID=1964365 RepID=UPI00356662DD
MKTISLFICIFILSACTIEEKPIPMSELNKGDATASCQDLSVEYTANTDRATSLLGGSNAKHGEANDLLDRNMDVRELAERKGCSTNLWPDQPKRDF